MPRSTRVTACSATASTGDGNGVAAAYMIPKPRNYLPGIFKFTSTTYGSKPLREDLLRTVRRGIRGTSMPAFPLFSPSDLEAVVDYVLALTHRGELESKLAEQAEFDEQIDEKRLPEMIAEILEQLGRGAGQGRLSRRRRCPTSRKRISTRARRPF